MEWQPEWGGSLRLYPTNTYRPAEGVEVKVPSPDHTIVIPPVFNQLAFFMLQSGESWHDVEDIARHKAGDFQKHGGRIRMAISGWFHIPQDGEDGYEDGLAEMQTKKALMRQEQRKIVDSFGLPQAQWRLCTPESMTTVEKTPPLTDEDLRFLSKYMAPQHLTSAALEQLSKTLLDQSFCYLSDVLSKNFTEKLHDFLLSAEQTSTLPSPPPFPTVTKSQSYGIASPPYRHRFLYRQPLSMPPEDESTFTPYDEVIEKFFPSPAFKKWLALATGQTLTRGTIVARRFRRGKDYTFKTANLGIESQLEVCLGITPITGWSDQAKRPTDCDGSHASQDIFSISGNIEAGGQQLYITKDNKNNQVHRVSVAGSADQGDCVLLHAPVDWNVMSVVLGDPGILSYVKYVSRAAPGDRWDVMGEFGLQPLIL